MIFGIRFPGFAEEGSPPGFMPSSDPRTLNRHKLGYSYPRFLSWAVGRFADSIMYLGFVSRGSLKSAHPGLYAAVRGADCSETWRRRHENQPAKRSVRALPFANFPLPLRLCFASSDMSSMPL